MWVREEPPPLPGVKVAMAPREPGCPPTSPQAWALLGNLALGGEENEL